MRSALPISLALFTLVSGCGRDESKTATTEPATPPVTAEPAPVSTASQPATATLAPTQGKKASGTLTLVAENAGVHVTGTITGLTPNGDHGIHIHMTGDCSAPDAKSAGEHFNPTEHPHGGPGPSTHVGDLGNITADAQGTAEVDARAEQATLRTGQSTDVLGKAVIVHAKADDMRSQPSGDSGDRIACGVIG